MWLPVGRCALRSIKPIGDRSKKKIWFARKKLNQTVELGLPSNIFKYDGFTFLINGINEEATIIPPMGAVVICTGPDESDDIKTWILVADHWKGSFNLKVAYNVLHTGIESGGVLYFYKGQTQEYMEDQGFETVPCVPAVVFDFYPPDQIEISYPNTMPWPVVFPFKGGEAYFLCISGIIWNDLDDDGEVDTGETNSKLEALVNYYASDAASMGGRITLYQEVDPTDLKMRIFQVVPSSGVSLVEHHTFTKYSTKNNKRVLATSLGVSDSEEYFTDHWYADDMWDSLPTDLKDDILPVPGNTAVKPIGSYAFALSKDGDPTLLHATDLTNTIPFTVPGADEETYFATGDKYWSLFYIINTLSDPAVYVIKSDQFINLLDTLQGGDILDGSAPYNLEVARETFQQFFPNPNHNFKAPYDSVMFHDEDGTVYTWTRKYGAVKFTTTGMFSQTLYLPSEVTSTDGVRPTIYFCGVYDEEALYLCICEDMSSPHEVEAVYYGTPFSVSSWTKLPDPETGYHLVNVRPVRMSMSEGIEDFYLLGILENESESIYNLAFLHYNDGSGEWKKLGQLPIVYGENYTWSVGFFGKGFLANEMMNFLNPPHVLPQMPIGPYDDYQQP